jgi:Skp family chaperone for outer membrane proteins
MKFRILATCFGLALAASIAAPSVGEAAVKKAATRKAPARKPVRKPVAKPVAKPAPKPLFMIPKPVVLRATTPAEAQAHAIWSVRAALNVAALQCNYSRWLATVKNYNDMLRSHGEELTRAQEMMLGHFRRYDKARGNTTFDQYNTRSYNSFSTLDAQYNFCDVAGRVGKDVRALPRGAFGAYAPGALTALRASLGRIALADVLVSSPPPLPPIPASFEIAE